MAKVKNWLAEHLPTRRRLIQLYAALLYNAHLRGFVEGEIYTGGTKFLCVPGLNCYSCPGAIGACPLGSLQNALASARSRAPFYVLGVLMLFGLLLGRVVCGFLCPFGLIQELLDKLPLPKLRKGRVTRALSYVKYVLLAGLVVIVPLVYAFQRFPLPAFCKYICPAGTLEGAVALLAHPDNADLFAMLGELFTSKFALLAAILAACAFIYRAFCRFLCPLGAIYGFFCRVALLGVKVDPELCTNCGLCVRQCRMDVRHVGDHECIHCGACAAACPTQAIRWRLPRKPARPRRWTRAAAWCAALAALACVLWFCNRPEPTVPGRAGTEAAPQATAVPGRAGTEAAPQATAVPGRAGTEAAPQATAVPGRAGTEAAPQAAGTPAVGSEVGMTCPDFEVPLYGGGTFALSQTRGKIVVLNFWATWCSPCCSELPYFERLWEAYPDDVALVAIHSELITDDVESYIAEMGYRMPFALDETGAVLEALGGSTMLPQTVILDRDGTIAYNRIGSMDYEALEAQVRQLMA